MLLHMLPEPPRSFAFVFTELTMLKYSLIMLGFHMFFQSGSGLSLIITLVTVELQSTVLLLHMDLQTSCGRHLNTTNLTPVSPALMFELNVFCQVAGMVADIITLVTLILDTLMSSLHMVLQHGITLALIFTFITLVYCSIMCGHVLSQSIGLTGVETALVTVESCPFMNSVLMSVS